ncbi:hypothetical protein TanjilG_29774 [Lupinus angustifolius]|uniref:Protein kinase domain-containing protein n=1 Tax=Lupinus angustifolius TaxID=3871 RepID=A0A394DCX5_LUPAN|nr:PREDICTED: uncharacterized protein LOC109339366 isoform X1 [Lupinus angustifolius]XP_019432335.1 PREDICTED: uncharacterized protein LOC109339366 isoform X1 [Lupinus angustifolius]XP_019432336.1 PREDICTED: uncharacterized protein LOC109339366 isoform X1 [Lupinus angustifolius]XP_019432337.1 PREDICTED: uncharacterized protein LOC109339366 isoform X1 [Lupinus angustifolius]OIW21118.1 hypothetical protein TanjilG_29774 [Lupinus angustifolius]
MQNQHQYNDTMEPRNEEFHPASQSIMQDHLDVMHINTITSDFNRSENKPVHNFSIQTGEEFALEFMRDRVNLGKPVFPNIVGEPNYSLGNMELKGILDIGHTGSESGSDISMLTKAEKGPKEFYRSNYGSVRSIPRNSSNQIFHRVVSSGASDSSSIKMKVLCSFGGRILPRPSDGKLRYVGGETRVISIGKDICWQELMQKASSIYNEVHVIKYQLPGEDLDALVSISSDEDLQNMMDECHDLCSRRGSEKLRVFLSSVNDLDDTRFGLGSIDGDSEIQYLIAINGTDSGSRNNSIRYGATTSANNIDELYKENIERADGRVPVESFGVSSSSLTGNVSPPLTIKASQPMLQTSNAFETYPVFYDGQVIHHGESTHYPLHRDLVYQGIVNEGHEPSELQARTSDFPAMQVKGRVDNFIYTDSGPVKVFSLETPYPVPLQPSDHNLQGNFSEALATVSVSEGYHPALPSPNNSKLQASEHNSLLVNTVNSIPIPKSGEEDLYATPSDAESNLMDLSFLEPTPLPNRVYYSERIPREQADLLNRSVKSEDARDSHLLMSDLLSDFNQKNSVTEYSGVTAVISTMTKPVHADGHTIHGGFTELQKHKPDAVSQVSFVERDENPSPKRPNFNRGEVSTRESNNDVQGQPFSVTENTSQHVYQDFPPGALSTHAQADILIDIDDRFPRDIIYDMFSKATISDASMSAGPLPTDGTGSSLNMESHEPIGWSYFQKLAQHGLDNVSLIDGDHLGFSSAQRKVQEESKSQDSTPLLGDGVLAEPTESRLNFGEENRKNIPVTTTTEVIVLHPNYDHSQIKDTENKNMDTMMENIRTQNSHFEDARDETRNAGIPQQDPSLGDLDFSTLQLIKNEDLEELRELGAGTFGTVYHGKWRGTDVAIKRIKKSCFTGRSSEQERLTVEFWREADILSKLHHPNVVAFYGVVQDGPGGTLATVAEFMVDGSLRHVLLRKDRYLDRRKRLIIAMDAAFGMEYLHAKNIVHFDLKCDNLLVNLKDPLRPICKVADFGLSKIKRNTLVSGGVRGTLPWMAPELLNGGSNKVSEKVDVFSFGIVLWEILTGEEPYANMHYGAIIGGIVNNTLRPTIPSYCDHEWRILMEQCWAPNPAVRPCFTEIARRLREMSAAATQTRGQGHKASKGQQI